MRREGILTFSRFSRHRGVAAVVTGEPPYVSGWRERTRDRAAREGYCALRSEALRVSACGLTDLET